MIRIYKYSSPSHTFVMVDGRDVEIPRFRKPAEVHALCLVHEVDAFVIVDHCESADFEMEIICGNSSACESKEEAGACAVAFADLLGIKPFHTQDYTFSLDGVRHNAFISSHLGECKEVSIDGRALIPCLCMGKLE